MCQSRLRQSGAQLDLFRSALPKPTWRMLPAAVTQRVQRLLARLLQQYHVACHAPRGGKGASDE